MSFLRVHSFIDKDFGILPSIPPIPAFSLAVRPRNSSTVPAVFLCNLRKHGPRLNLSLYRSRVFQGLFHLCPGFFSSDRGWLSQNTLFEFFAVRGLNLGIFKCRRYCDALTTSQRGSDDTKRRCISQCSVNFNCNKGSYWFF